MKCTNKKGCTLNREAKYKMLSAAKPHSFLLLNGYYLK